MENVEDMESESGGLDYLDVPEVKGELLLPVVVLRKIFENLSSADLLNLSLVNKDWHYEAQSVLRDRGSLTAKMTRFDARCKDPRAFASVLRRMREVRKVVPFSGLTVAIGGAGFHDGDWCTKSSIGELDQVYEDILHRMEWKHLALRLRDGWYRRKNCSGFQLMKKILDKCCCLLEEFSLSILSDHEAFIQQYLQDRNFPRLKTLKFKGLFGGGDEALIKALVSRSPNLKVLSTKGHVNLRADLLEESAAVHVYDFPYSVRVYADADIPEKIVCQLRLRQIRLSLVHEDFNYERFSGIVSMLLQKSRTTLISMQVDAVLLVGLMHYGICLENVSELTVEFHGSDTLQPRSRGLLKSFDFTCIFPNLRSVSIRCTMHSIPNREHAWDAIIDRVEQGNPALIEPVNRSVNIKQLHLVWFPGIQDASIRFFVNMFPHIKKLFIDGEGVPFVRFWDYWLDLEEIDIRLRVTPDIDVNLDSAICGIFPEEVAGLRERDEEYLLSVNIVPVMPSLSCLKRLKIFRLFFDCYRSSSIVGPTSTLSKVTGLIAFKRRPGLTVSLETNSDRWKGELQQMDPYASVRLTNRRQI